jgi:hypothetical protein
MFLPLKIHRGHPRSYYNARRGALLHAQLIGTRNVNRGGKLVTLPADIEELAPAFAFPGPVFFCFFILVFSKLIKLGRYFRHTHFHRGKGMPTATTKDGTEIFYKDWATGEPLFFHQTGGRSWRTTGTPR